MVNAPANVCLEFLKIDITEKWPQFVGHNRPRSEVPLVWCVWTSSDQRCTRTLHKYNVALRWHSCINEFLYFWNFNSWTKMSDETWSLNSRSHSVLLLRRKVQCQLKTYLFRALRYVVAIIIRQRIKCSPTTLRINKMKV